MYYKDKPMTGLTAAVPALPHVSLRLRFRLTILLLAVCFIWQFSPLSSFLGFSSSSVFPWPAKMGHGGAGAGEHVPPRQSQGLPPTTPKAATPKAAASAASPNTLDEPDATAAGVPAASRDAVAARLRAAEAAVGLPGASKPNAIMDQFMTWRLEATPDYTPPPKPPAKTPQVWAKPPPVVDPFPLLSRYPPPDPSLLRAPAINRPPPVHFPVETPLLIGFTRNWPQLLQCVVSYIAAGWPPEDIYVVENTGVMYSNRDGLLTLQNPFFLNHTQLAMLGVNVLVTPTLLTFAQLQNYYVWTALERQWADFFWSHEDLVVFSFEDQLIPDVGTSDTNTTDNTTPGDPPRTYSLYERAAGVLQALRRPDAPRWAHHFFHYDHLTLVHRDAILDIGGWDTHILFYATDCDMYYRLMWAGYQQAETTIGHIFDVATVLDDVGALLRVPGVEAGFDGDPGPPPPSREREPVDPSVDDEDEDEDVVPTSPWQGPRRHRVPGRPPQAEEEWSVEEEGLDGTDARKREDEKKRWEEKKEWQVRKRAEDAKRREAERRRQEARRKAEEAEAEHVRQVTRYGETYAHLVELSERMASLKSESGGGRNMWQQRQSGGDGEPFHRDPDGFEIGLQRLIETGRIIFSEKWGHRGCDIGAMGYGPEDAWRLEHDWDEQIDGNGAGGPSW